MTLDELNRIIIAQNQHIAIDKHKTCYECYNIHTNRLITAATTIDELKETLINMDVIRG